MTTKIEKGKATKNEKAKVAAAIQLSEDEKNLLTLVANDPTHNGKPPVGRLVNSRELSARLGGKHKSSGIFSALTRKGLIKSNHKKGKKAQTAITLTGFALVKEVA
jgi:hypothetical protein